MEWLATLLTDMILEEPHFHGLLQDVAQNPVAGWIAPRGFQAWHSLKGERGEAGTGDLLVEVQMHPTLPAAIQNALLQQGFTAATALRFQCPPAANLAEVWTILGLYAEELRGWIFGPTTKLPSALSSMPSNPEFHQLSTTTISTEKTYLTAARLIFSLPS